MRKKYKWPPLPLKLEINSFTLKANKRKGFICNELMTSHTHTHTQASVTHAHGLKKQTNKKKSASFFPILDRIVYQHQGNQLVCRKTSCGKKHWPTPIKETASVFKKTCNCDHSDKLALMGWVSESKRSIMYTWKQVNHNKNGEIELFVDWLRFPPDPPQTSISLPQEDWKGHDKT